MHSKGISHRDIKGDNILISPAPAESLKICDFGSAKHLPAHNTVSEKGSVTYISTRYYRGPELLYSNTRYGTEIDLWAAGCVLAELFTKGVKRPGGKGQESYTLFRGDSNTHQLYLIIRMKGPPTKRELELINPAYKNAQNFPEVKPEGLGSRLEPGTPKEVVELISALLTYAPQERITAKDALLHPFFDEVRGKQSKASTRVASKATSASSHKRGRD